VKAKIKIVTFCTHWNPFWCVPDSALDELREIFPDVSFVKADNQQQLIREMENAEIFFGYDLNPEALASAKQLKWIHVPAANVYQFIRPDLRERKITLTNARGMHATVISEQVIGSMLVFSRRFMDCWKFQQEHHYSQPEMLSMQPPLSELHGKTVVILGLGSIGREIARLSKAFGMRVIASKKNIQGTYENVNVLYSSTDFRKALPEADYLVISMARTPDTDSLLGQQELSMLKTQCVIINIARARIIDQQALLQVLKEKKIRGAALDVFEKEPLPSDSELFSLPNVFLTPHTAGVATREHWPRMIQLFIENLHRYLLGKPLTNVVDLMAGY
jgi:phosphoglycerate dehydrogenase-like enzyme